LVLARPPLFMGAYQPHRAARKLGHTHLLALHTRSLASLAVRHWMNWCIRFTYYLYNLLIFIQRIYALPCKGNSLQIHFAAHPSRPSSLSILDSSDETHFKMRSFSARSRFSNNRPFLFAFACFRSIIAIRLAQSWTGVEKSRPISSMSTRLASIFAPCR
jgi:hypothetical protein